MEWKNIGAAVARGAPMLGTLLGGPAGGIIGAMVSSALGVPNNAIDVNKALETNPEAFIILRRVEIENETRLRELSVDLAKTEINADAENIKNINTTMQLEAGSERWPAYSWRPFIGFAVGFNLFCAGLLVLTVFIPIMFGNQQVGVAMSYLPGALAALAGINATALPILGIAAWHRGKMQADPAIPPPIQISKIK